MEIIPIEKNKEKIVFILKDVKPSFANELRRIMISEVPVMAIEDVEFKENSSILYDEIIAHRLGLIPLSTDLKSYNLPEECSCNGELCAKCSVKLTLKAKGPCVVYASDLRSKDPKIKPVYPKMPIVELLKDQKLELEATAILGKGKDHMKSSPCLAYFRYKPEIERTKECDGCGRCVEVCPKEIIKIKENKVIVDKDSVIKCDLCKSCVEVCPKNAIKLIENENEIIFYLESWGQLSPKEILQSSLKILDEKLDDFLDAFKGKSKK